MCRYGILLAVCLGLAGPALSLAQDQKANADQSAQIKKLIEQLASPSYMQRTKALLELEKVGAAALPALKEAVKNTDSETSKALGILLAKLEDQKHTAKVLAPKQVQLKVQDMPVMEIMKELTKQTGYNIQFKGPPNDIERLRLSLDTGKAIPFWEAFDLVCAKAGLTLVQQPNVNVPQPPYYNGKGSKVYYPPGNIQPNQPLTVEKGTGGKPLPTFYNGAVRLQISAPSVVNGEVQFTLTVNGEPGLDNFSLNGAPLVEKAMDEHGQALSMILKYIPNTMVSPSYPYNNPYAYNNMPKVTQYQVSLKPGDKTPHQIKNLQGSVTAHLLLPTEPILTVKDVMKANGKAVQGKNGGIITVQNIQKIGNQYHMDVQIENPPGNNGFPNVGFGGNVVINGNVIINGNPINNNSQTLVLVDAQGKSLQYAGMSKNSMNFNGAKITRQMTVLFTAAPDQGEPDRLMLVGREMDTVSIPFHFENLLLP